ncbi:methylenetetrahydrofolate--tRNA-(uracil-5-)-methyltransferase TrmFO [Clostridia bacterium]|nr:methylenetetrahydrofolate--tRNA-(uracil-5-)-methyltransferase TrmFO [Clostridia bacterium]
MNATVVGAGLAGSEAAWQLARRGVAVELIDMKPALKTAAHVSSDFAELVCSNSLKSNKVTNASGLLKEEMRRLGSLIIECADETSVAAGDALAVDRDKFAALVTARIREHLLITIKSRDVCELPSSPVIIATGPLTSDGMSSALQSLAGMTKLNFYDAAAPIVTYESIDMSRAFRQDRNDKSGDIGGYINCPLNRDEYFAFYNALVLAEVANVHGADRDLDKDIEANLYEGCMPVEAIARRGDRALSFGPMKPVGLVDPHTGRMPYAVAQLRAENAQGTLYNLVGFQTRLKFPEQRRVFGMIPALAHAEFARYGVMHRNTYVNAPDILNEHFEVRRRTMLYLSGQLTGVEGYVPSAASGLVAGLDLANQINGIERVSFPPITAIGALCRYVTTPNRDYQPMGIQFGLLDSIYPAIKNKLARCQALADKALSEINRLA